MEYPQDYPTEYHVVIGWAHQCWQLYKLGNDIDYTEFKARLNIPTVDFRQFMLDNQEELNLRPDNDKLYIQRIIDCLEEQGE